jgi:O-antigen ligase
MSLGIIWGIFERPLGVFQNSFLSFNSFLGFFLIPILISDQKRLKQFLLAMILCGVFPILVSIYQLQTGIFFQERATVGLTRYVGLYHDAFPVRFFGVMTLISILIYQYVFQIRNVLFKVFLISMAVGALLSIYAVFSKAGVGIVGLWVVLLLLFSKSKIKQSFSILVGLSVIFLVFGDTVSSNVEQLFSKEVGYQSGEITDARYTLSGRGYIWQEYWDFWTTKQTVLFQWFGDGISRPVHNEYFRVLLTNGIIGVLLLIIFVFKIAGNLLKMNKNVRVFGIMLLGMYLIDSIGLVPGLYYYYNILVWGIFGILLMKPQLFIKQ